MTNENSVRYVVEIFLKKLDSNKQHYAHFFTSFFFYFTYKKLDSTKKFIYIFFFIFIFIYFLINVLF